MISYKLNTLVERIKISCATRLLLSIDRGRANQKPITDDKLFSLFSGWMSLLVSEKKPLPAEFVHHIFATLLSQQSHSASVELLRSSLLAQLPAEVWPLIPSLEKRSNPVLNTWCFQNEVMEWDIAPDELVLDIGSGGWPFKRANHLADKYPDKTSHRVEAMVRDSRPFFEVDLEHLPFSELEYDFVFCSHVLEHMDNPGQAIRELMRVGKKGYIEVPTRLSDVLFNFTKLPDHHRWHGLALGNTLVLIEWNDWERHDMGNHFFNALHSEYENAFQDFFERNRDMFFTSYHWHGSINFLVIDKLGNIIDSSYGRSDRFSANS